MKLKKVAMHVAAAACLGLSSTALQAAPRTAFVHLFEWQWNDVAYECENYLGPNGFSAVQVSPPQKSIDGGQWWTRYQPVSYAIQGRSGSREEFASMVQRCKNAGVDIYVDAVINHMAAWDRNFPEVPYSSNDFHNCREDINYGDAWMIQNCDLSGLNDLKTESDYVRGKIADYMNDMLSLGVAGFRIDAAKHIYDADIANIISRLNGTPYIYQEVIGAESEPVKTTHYTYIGDVTEFNFSSTIGNYFKGRGALKDLANIGVWPGWLASDEAVVFVANHDNQRQNTSNIITHKDGNETNDLAHAFMLAWPYGYPKVMSSYDWNDHDQGPPSAGAAGCDNGWLCEHRRTAIKNMVAFRNNTAAEWQVTNAFDNGGNKLAFGRGGLGFFAMNGDWDQWSTGEVQTGMPEGVYCDVYHGDFNATSKSCSGPTVTVNSEGKASFNVPQRSAVAIHVGAIVDGECTDCPPPGDCQQSSMNLRGTFNSWGTDAMTCTDGVWEGSATFSGASTDRFRFDVNGDWSLNYGDTNADGVAEQGGEDIYVTEAGTYKVSFNDSSMAYTVVKQGGGEETTTVDVSFTCNNGTTYVGQSVYVVGNHAALGNWAPASGVKLDPTSYPSWSGTVTLPTNTAVEWKCVKRDEADATAGVEWQGGANNSVTATAGATTSGSF